MVDLVVDSILSSFNRMGTFHVLERLPTSVAIIIDLGIDVFSYDVSSVSLNGFIRVKLNFI